MSISDNLLIILTNYSGGYKLMRQKLYSPTYPWPPGYKKIKKTQDEAIKEIKEIKDQTLRIILSRLKKRGLIENENKIWKITDKGKDYLKNILPLKTPSFKKIKNENAKRNMIIVFDIPETRRKQRNWLRFNLIALGFVQLQKSVWFGPAPLPKKFIEYLNDTNILQYLKFFKATEEEIISSN